MKPQPNPSLFIFFLSTHTNLTLMPSLHAHREASLHYAQVRRRSMTHRRGLVLNPTTNHVEIQ
jgi:hypothetical protein